MMLSKYNFYAILMLVAAANAVENVNLNYKLCNETVRKLLSDRGVAFYKINNVCCQGYPIDTSEQCMSNFQRPCIHAFCKAPNLCDCKQGYETRENCISICKQKGVKEYCIKPDVCLCKHGFELDDTNKCGSFSKCEKSLLPKNNSFQCVEGYVRNEKANSSKPYCKNKCNNGICIVPETCSCKNGFEFHVNKTNCIPKCDPKCQKYSSCTAPNVCACDDGYKLNDVNKLCEPICSDNIENSRCIKPPNTWICIDNYQHDRRIDKCVLEYCSCNSYGYCLDQADECMCYDGFTKNITTGQCEPQCQPLCENSNCVANNVCECLDEYHKTPVDHFCERNDYCNNLPCKNGECLITGECRCKAGYVKSLSYIGKIQCDTVQKFVGKLMAMVLGVPVVLTCSVFVIYAITKKKSYDLEGQGENGFKLVL